METLYDVLEVSRKASKEVIEKAYKTLAKKYHPDLQASEDKTNAEEMMKKINDAYSVLSDDKKRQQYDAKLEEEEHKIINNNVYSQPIYNSSKGSENDNWREAYSKLSPKEQKRLKKRIEKEANEEYKKMYADYLRSLGYRMKHRWTFKEFLTVALAIAIIIIILLILWWIPITHEWMINMYEQNIVVKIVADIVIGIFKGFAEFFKK